MPVNNNHLELPEELFLTLIQGCNIARKWAHDLVEKQGITLAEYHFLRIVQNETKTTATVIKERLSATAPTIAQAVANLERKKMIKRVKDKTDQRIQCIELTASGKKIVAAVRKEVVRSTNELSLPSEVLRQAIDNMQTITSALNSHPPYGR